MLRQSTGTARGILRTLRGIGGREEGQALVEVALTLPLLLLLLMGTVEVGLLYYTRLTVRHVTLEATRFAVTGNRLVDPESGGMLTRGQSIERAVRVRASRFSVAVDSIAMDPADGGRPNEVVRVTVHYRYTFSLPLVGAAFPEPIRYFQVSTAMKNEPFR